MARRVLYKCPTIERGSTQWNSLLEKYYGDSFKPCASCGAPFMQGRACSHCTDQSPHVSQADKIKHGYPLEYKFR